eukprot:scaffold415028_cov16-Prasinocladus_malaysianus.AAC.1
MQSISLYMYPYAARGSQLANSGDVHDLLAEKVTGRPFDLWVPLALGQPARASAWQEHGNMQAI